MAEGLLFGTAGKILEVLGSQIFHEIGLAYGVQDEITELRATFRSIHAVLLDAEEQYNRHNHAVSDWLRRLKDAVYAADDLLDDFSTEFLRRKAMTGNVVIKEVCIFFSKYNQHAYALKMAHEIKGVRKRLESIKNDRQFHLNEHLIDRRILESTRRETGSYVSADEIIGRDEDKNKIIHRLLTSNDDQSVSVIPIVGMGGLGKTSVAQLVYNDEAVKKHFDLRLWVCVSVVFDVREVLEKIIASVDERKCLELSMDQLQKAFHKRIDRKKYLLVLDDVWCENRGEWVKLETHLKSGARGSMILITTRSERVARVTSNLTSHVLEGLPDDKSWFLFKRMAFDQGLEPTPKLVEIGKDILRKCVGVPLAIRTIGCLLYCNRTEAHWSQFRDHELSKIDQEAHDILPTLKLSYDHLPSHLKQCFAYCALFPKDYEIEKKQLIFFWMAQGFLRSSTNEDQSLEAVGDECFMSLLSRCFFQNVEYDAVGNISKCKIHDLMHDLAESVAETECVKVKLDGSNIDERSRHVLFMSDLSSSRKFPTFLSRVNDLRTFSLSPYKILSEFNLNKIFSSFKRLRTLNLSRSGIKVVPNSIGKLKHLRYLNLSFNHALKKLSNSVSRLLNLETLDLTDCYELTELPRDIGRMVSLRHLIIEGCDIGRMPNGIGRLISLRTLSLFVVSRRNELRQLNGLNNLSGALRIKILSGKQNTGSLADLEAKKYLESLSLYWARGRSNTDDVDQGLLLDGLKPHKNLKQLEIYRFGGVRLSNWLSSLSNLTSIDIFDCPRYQYIPQLDQLPCLKNLSLRDFPDLEYISLSSTPSATIFPSLEFLKITGCLKLKGWSRRIEDEDEDGSKIHIPEPFLFPCLSRLFIYSCPKLISMPLYPSLEELDIRDSNLKTLQNTMMMTKPFSKLKSLIISGIDETWPEEWFRNLSSIVELYIESCRTFRLSQGIRHLTALKKLRIYECEEVDLLVDDEKQHIWRDFQSLWSISLENIGNMVTLPQGLATVPTLGVVEIINFRNLMNLPQGLQLKFLEIKLCPKLTILSEGLQLKYLYLRDCPELSILPEGLQLESLTFSGCPKLYERYGNNTAVDWPKIAHIPNIRIDWERIQVDGRYQLDGESIVDGTLLE